MVIMLSFALLDIGSVLTVLLSIWILNLIRRFYANSLRSIPGPWYTRITGLVLKWHAVTGNRCHYIHSLHRSYGNLVRISPTEVAAAGLDDCLKIHKLNSGFLKTSWYTKLNDQPRRACFSMIDPQEHAARRRLFGQAFSKSGLRAKWEGTVVERMQLAISSILRAAQSGEVDMLRWWTFMATDVSAHVMFGDSMRMLEAGKKTDYIQLLECVIVGVGIGAEFPLLRWIGKRLPFTRAQLMFNGTKRLRDCAEPAVKNAKAGKNIFSSAFTEVKKGYGEMDELDIQVEAGNLIVAGSDTTAVTLTYLIWAVLQRPDLRLRLQQEINTLPTSFTDVDLEALSLVNATIDETLRLYGAAPSSLPRLVPSAGTTLSGHFLPAGAVVSTQAWTTHRDPSIFTNPNDFIPDRWLTETETLATARSAMSPFGRGARTCLGIHLAMMELRYGLVLFLRMCEQLELAPSTTTESMAVENFFLTAPKAHRCNLISKEQNAKPLSAVNSPESSCGRSRRFEFRM